MYERYEELIKELGITTYRLCKDTGIPASTFSDWKKGKSSPKIEKMQKVADYLNVRVEYLLGTSDIRTKEELSNHWDSTINTKELAMDVKRNEEFSKRDKRDIAKTMNFMLEQLDNYQDALMFDGDALDDETRELLKDSIANSIKVAKVIAKNKFNPNKNKM